MIRRRSLKRGAQLFVCAGQTPAALLLAVLLLRLLAVLLLLLRLLAVLLLLPLLLLLLQALLLLLLLLALLLLAIVLRLHALRHRTVQLIKPRPGDRHADHTHAYVSRNCWPMDLLTVLHL